MDVILLPLIKVIDMALGLFMWAVLISVILSWLVQFNVVNTRNQFVYMVGNMLHKVTEPVLRPIRRIVPDLGGLDISPIILFLIIIFIRGVLQNLMIRM